MADITFGPKSDFVDTVEFDLGVEALSSSKCVVFYDDGDDSNHGTAKIGTITGSGITFGSEAEFYSGGISRDLAAGALSSSGFVVIGRRQNEGAGWIAGATVGEVSGTTITFGSVNIFEASFGSYVDGELAVLSPTKFAMFYRDYPTYGATTHIGEVSGTTITFGSQHEFFAGNNIRDLSIAAISSSGFLIAYEDLTGSNNGLIRVCDVDGTVVTANDAVVFRIGGINDTSLTMLDSERFIIAYFAANKGWARVGTVVGTTVTLGDEYLFLDDTLPADIHVASFSSSKFVIAYTDEFDSNHGTAKIGTVDGNVITFTDESEYNSGGTSRLNKVSVLDDSNFVVAYKDVTESDNGTVNVGQLSLPSTESASGNLFISASVDIMSSGNLFIEGVVPVTDSHDLWIHGPELVFASGTLFTFAPPPDVYNNTTLYLPGPEIVSSSADLFSMGSESINNSCNLFIGELSSGLQLRIINRLTKTGDYDPQLIGAFDVQPISVGIEVWDIVDGQNIQIDIASSGCYAIGDTKRWGWSTAHLGFTGERNKYHYYFRMIASDSANVYGEFLITVPEDVLWSSPNRILGG